MAVILLLFLLIPLNAIAATSGPARVIDGDTIDIAGQRIRLHGIDTPEAKQTCQRDGVTWLCGAAATKALKELIGNSDVSCAQRDMDRYGRIVAVCRANGVDLNAVMVQSGMALAYRKYSDDYSGQEASAKAARRGLWAGQFVPPWEWRRGKRLASKAAANDNPEGCRIKGNIGSKGDRIYHMPGGRWYDRTVITASKGERWFCSEGEAKATGWQRATKPFVRRHLANSHLHIQKWQHVPGLPTVQPGEVHEIRILVRLKWLNRLMLGVRSR
jgi:endonuclease YncB( thermonuclease family)